MASSSGQDVMQTRPFTAYSHTTIQQCNYGPGTQDGWNVKLAYDLISHITECRRGPLSLSCLALMAFPRNLESLRNYASYMGVQFKSNQTLREIINKIIFMRRSSGDYRHLFDRAYIQKYIYRNIDAYDVFSAIISSRDVDWLITFNIEHRLLNDASKTGERIWLAIGEKKSNFTFHRRVPLVELVQSYHGLLAENLPSAPVSASTISYAKLKVINAILPMVSQIHNRMIDIAKWMRFNDNPKIDMIQRRITERLCTYDIPPSVCTKIIYLFDGNLNPMFEEFLWSRIVLEDPYPEIQKCMRSNPNYLGTLRLIKKLDQLTGIRSEERKKILYKIAVFILINHESIYDVLTMLTPDELKHCVIRVIAKIKRSGRCEAQTAINIFMAGVSMPTPTLKPTHLEFSK